MQNGSQSIDDNISEELSSFQNNTYQIAVVSTKQGTSFRSWPVLVITDIASLLFLELHCYQN